MSHSWCRDIERDEAIRAAEDAAANWRRLEVGEVIEEGDEFQKKDGNWLPVDHAWVGEAVTVYHRPHRRRRVPPPDSRDLPAAVAELRERVARLEAVIPKSVSVSNAEEPENKGGTMPDIDPGTGWRLLAEDEVIEQGDEWLTPPSYLNVWQATCYRGGGATPRRTGDTYRRRVEAKDTQPAPVPAADGLRAERVTPPSWQERKWDEALAVICDGGDWGRGNNFDHGVIGALVIWADGEMDRLAAERDAAIRERDGLNARVDYLERDRKHWCVTSGFHETQANAFRVRVAEMESAAKLAPAANAGAESNHAAPAASGAAGTEPEAWAVRMKSGRYKGFLFESEEAAQKCAELITDDTVPLYAAPQPASGWLTEEEREAVEEARDFFDGDNEESSKFMHRMLSVLLARSSPPEVVLPRECGGLRYDSFVAGWNGYRDEVKKALAAAGVKWKEVWR